MSAVLESSVPESAVQRASRAAGRRNVIMLAVLSAILITIGVLGLCLGAYALSIGEIIDALAGRSDPLSRLVVVEIRLPRVLLGAIAGAAFGVAGAIFQTVLRNPLASPDIIGVSAGASAAAVLGVIVLGVSGLALSGVAVAGALLSALIISVLAGRGRQSVGKLVLIGVAWAFLANAAIGYLLTRSRLEDAQTALVWMVGSLDGVRMDSVVLLLATAVPLLVAVGVIAPRLRILQLDEDIARSLGVRAESTRWVALGVASGLVAVAASVVGPIAFVAFASAPIARRLVGHGTLALAASGAVGAGIVMLADLVAEYLLPDWLRTPVGVVTGLFGGVFLLCQLASANRIRRTR